MLKALFIILVVSSSLSAQNAEMRFEHLSSEQGLSQNSVLCILQDQRGFLWFGTEDGLNKYDGYSFTVYKIDIYDTTSISENHILSLCKDHNGILWIGTEGGLNRYNYSTNSFRNKHKF